jgi:cell division protein FtsL
MALAVVVGSYAIPVRSWWYQRGEIAAAEQQRETLTAQIEALQAEQDQWADPAFVRARARERLNLVRPGEVGVLVPGLPDAPGEQQGSVGLVAPQAGVDAPWWATMWAGVQLVGAGPRATAPTDGLSDAPRQE